MSLTVIASHAVDILSWACLLAGGALTVIGALGVLRFPDVFTRMHAASITDTLATLLILVGAALQSSGPLMVFKLALIFLFIVFTSPVATHALARSALVGGAKPNPVEDLTAPKTPRPHTREENA